jgi:hypothetical protein
MAKRKRSRKLTTLTLNLLIFRLSSLIDKGSSIKIEDAYTHVKDNGLLPWLKKTFDLSLGDIGDKAVREIHERMDSISNARCASDFDVEKNGLCLLLAWTNEMLQERWFKLMDKPENN